MIDEDAALAASVSFASNRQNPQAQSMAFSRYIFDEYGLHRLEETPDTINLADCVRGLESGFLALHQQLLDMGCFVGHDLAYEFKEKRGRQAILLKRLPWTRAYDRALDGIQPPAGWQTVAPAEHHHLADGRFGWGSRTAR